LEGGFLLVDTIPFLIPWAIDAAEGAGFAHQQTSVIAHLDPEGGANAPTKAIAPLSPALPSANTATKTQP
jgi:hypothetical protein